MAGLLFPHKVLQSKAVGSSEVRSLKKTQQKWTGPAWSKQFRENIFQKDVKEDSKKITFHKEAELKLFLVYSIVQAISFPNWSWTEAEVF